MAYDPEARRQSNSALIIALVGLLVLGGGALAYFASRNNAEPAPATTIVNTPADRETVVVNNTVTVPVPVVEATSAPNVVVREVPRTVVVPGNNTTTRIERNTTTVRDRVVAPRPATGSGSSTTPAASSNTNVTVNVPPSGATSTDSAANSTTTDSAANTAPADSGSATGNTAGY